MVREKENYPLREKVKESRKEIRVKGHPKASQPIKEKGQVRQDYSQLVGTQIMDI
jgi:hypothetical protein